MTNALHALASANSYDLFVVEVVPNSNAYENGKELAKKFDLPWFNYAFYTADQLSALADRVAELSAHIHANWNEMNSLFPYQSYVDVYVYGVSPTDLMANLTTNDGTVDMSEFGNAHSFMYEKGELF